MNSQEIQEEIKRELLDINNILLIISKELKEIKNMTHPSGEMSKSLKKNAISMQSLAKLCKMKIDLSESLADPGATALQSKMETQMSHLLHDTFRDDTF